MEEPFAILEGQTNHKSAYHWSSHHDADTKED
jgi:hypothetical protein